MPIRKYLAPDHHFDPETLVIMGQAYEKACRDLHDSGQPSLVQEVIASRIISSAARGERDLDKLCAAGLTALTIRPIK